MNEKPQVSKGECPLLCQAFYYMEKWRFPLYSDDVLTNGDVFSLPHILTNFLLFSLMFYLGSCPNSLATCPSYSLTNVARYKRQMSNYDSPIEP